MTTIAVRDGVMAADSQMTDGHLRLMGCQKIYPVGAALVGITGSLASALVFVDWYENRESRRPDLSNESDFEALILTAEGLDTWTANLRPIPVRSKFWAVGSGSHLAIGAMAMGASAVDAVKVACAFDIHSSGDVTVAQLPQKPKRRRRKG